MAAFKSMKGHVVTTDPYGVVKVSGKEVAKVAAGYKDKSHGCALHCFFSAENEDVKEIDEEIKIEYCSTLTRIGVKKLVDANVDDLIGMQAYRIWYLTMTKKRYRNYLIT